MHSQLFRTSVSRIPLFCHHCRNILLVIALSSRHDLKSESKAIKHINNSAEARIGPICSAIYKGSRVRGRFLGNSLMPRDRAITPERIWQNRWIPQL